MASAIRRAASDSPSAVMILANFSCSFFVKGIIRNERNKYFFVTDAPSQQQTLLVRPTDELTKTLSILWHC